MTIQLKKIAKPFLFFILTYLFISTILVGQTIQANSVGIVVGGDFGFRLISGDETDPATVEALNNRAFRETFKLNRRFGFNYYHGIGANLLIKTGIRLSNPGFTISSVEDIDIDENINDIIKQIKDRGADYKYKYQIVEIPLAIKKVIAKAYCQPYFEAGISTNIYRKTIVEQTLYEGISTNKTIIEEINRFNFVGFLSMGGNFKITNDISGFTQIIGRYQLNNLRKSVLSEKMISLGLELGVKYYLN